MGVTVSLQGEFCPWEQLSQYLQCLKKLGHLERQALLMAHRDVWQNARRVLLGPPWHIPPTGLHGLWL